MARFAAANPLSDDTGILKQALIRLIQLLDTGYVVESTLNGVTYRISITAKEGIVITADGTEVMWIDTATGNIRFSGDITGSSGTFSGTISGGSIYIPNSTTPVFSVTTNGKTTIKSVADIYNGIVVATSASLPSYSFGAGLNNIACGNFGTLPNAEYDGDLGLWVNGQSFFDDDVLTDGSFIADNDVLPRIADRSWCGTDAKNFTQVWGRQIHAKDDVYGDSFIANSDARLKTDIEPVINGVDLILKLNPVQYRMIDGQRTHYGFIAQELKQAMTDCNIEDAGVYVDKSFDINPDTGLPYSDYLAVRYDELISPMVQTIQHLEQRIKDLEARLEPSV